MAGAGTEVGRIHIKVTPDTDGFRAALEAQVKAATRGLTANVSAQLQNADEIVTKTKAAVKAASGEKVKVGVEATSLDRFQQRLLGQLRSAFSKIEPKLELTPDGEATRRSFEKTERAIANSIRLKIPLSLDEASLQRQDVQRLVDKAVAIEKAIVKIELQVDEKSTNSIKKRIDNLREAERQARFQYQEEIREWADKEAEIARKQRVDLQPQVLKAKFDIGGLQAETDRINREFQVALQNTFGVDKRLDVALEPNISSFDPRAIRAKLRALFGRPIEIPVEVDQDSFRKSVSKIKPPKIPNFDKFIPNFGTGLNPAGYAVVIAGILAVAAPLVGLITSALLTLPGLISAVAIPIAAITLGLDGFKKAAEAIKEPFDALRASISNKVESQFTPIFEQITQAFPILERSIPRVTQGLADIAGSVTTFLTEGVGANQLEQLIGGIGDRLAQVAPGVRDFTAALLGLANQFVNGGALEGVGAWFNDTMADFKDWVAEMSASGELDAAFRGLGESLKVVADALGKIALEGLDFITDPGKVRGFTDALAGLGEVLKDIVGISESLAPAFKLLDLALKIPSVAGVLVDMGNRGRDIGAALGDGVEAGVDAGFKIGADLLVPPDIGAAVSEQIKNQITVSAEDQKQALRSAFTAGGVDTAVSQQLSQQIQAAIQSARDAMTQFGPELQTAVDNSLLSLATIGDKVGAAFTGIGPAVAMGFTPAVEAAASGVSQIIQTISSGFGNLYNTVVGALSGMASAVSAGMATGAQAAATAVTNILEVISAGLSALPAVVSAWFSAVPPAIASSMAPAITTVADICQQMVSTALSFAGAMESAGYSIGASFAAGLGKSGGLVSDAAGNLMGLARAFFPNSPAKTGPFSGSGWVDKSGEAIGMSFADGISGSAGTVVSTAKELMQAVKDVFGDLSGLVLNFNFGGGSGGVGVGGLTGQMSDATTAAKGFQSALTDSVNPTRQLDASAKAQVTELSRQLALLEQRRKELELMRFGDQDNTGIKAELDLIRQQKLALGLEKDRLTYAQKYEGTVTSTNDKYDQQLQQLASMPLDFAKTTANSFMSDFGISGQGALPALANWGIEAGSKYIFNVNGVDEAKALWQNQVNVESMGVVGR